MIADSFPYPLACVMCAEIEILVFEFLKNFKNLLFLTMLGQNHM
jgi:hypothetical protein